MKSANYRVRDNGIRTFIPPCFCWELINIDSGMELVVSEIDLSPLHLSSGIESKLLLMLASGSTVVHGFVIDGPIPAGGIVKGKILVITDLPAS